MIHTRHVLLLTVRGGADRGQGPRHGLRLLFNINSHRRIFPFKILSPRVALPWDEILTAWSPHNEMQPWEGLWRWAGQGLMTMRQV